MTDLGEWVYYNSFVILRLGFFTRIIHEPNSATLDPNNNSTVGLKVIGMREVIDHGSTGDTSIDTDRDTETGIPLENSNIQEEKDAGTGASSELHEEETKDVVPNGGYGWVNVGCVVLQNSVTWGRYICHQLVGLVDQQV